MGDFQAKSVIESFNFALRGLAYAFRTQRNLRIHLLIAMLVILVAIALRLPNEELAMLAIAIGIVLVSEMANTALEAAVDLMSPKFHPLAAVAKDVAAGAVLIASITAAAVGYLVFFERLANLRQEALARTVTAPPQITFFALLLVLILVIAMKLAGNPVQLQGGMPSVHTAAAASLATSVFFLSESALSAVLAAALALLVAQSRVEARIHSIWETAAGGLIGTLLTTLLFQLLQ